MLCGNLCNFGRLIVNFIMMFNKFFLRIVVVCLISVFVLGSCSTNKKLKKQCKDCPEFSLNEESRTATVPDENL